MIKSNVKARYRKVCPRCWQDEKFVDLTPVQKLILLYVITAQSNRIGLFKFSGAMASEELCLPHEEFLRDFSHVVTVFGWGWDDRARVLYLPTWWKYNPPENPSHMQGVLADLAELPKTALLDRFIEATRPFAIRYRVDLPELSGTAPAQGVGHGAPHPVQDQADTTRAPCPAGVPHQEQELKQELEQEQEEDGTPTTAAENPSETKNPAEPVILTFPTIGTGAKQWHLTSSQVAAWEVAYPDMAIVAECQKALVWTEANGRKTARGMKAFLVGWFNRGMRMGGFARRSPISRTHSPPSASPRANVNATPDELRELL